MKSLVVIVAIMLCASLLPARQSPVSTYLQFLETQASDIPLKKTVAALSTTELEHVARMIYEANESDPVAVMKYMGKNKRAFDSAYARNKSNEGLGWTLNAVQAMCIDQIDTILSKRIYALVSVPYKRTNLNTTVLDVFNGKQRFSVGGDTCLVLADPRPDPQGKLYIAIVVFLDQSYGYYMIRNNILHDQYNTFGYGTEVPWKDFRDSLLSQIKEIKSW